MGLMRRLVSAIVLLAVVMSALWLGGVAADLLLGCAAAVALWEYSALARLATGAPLYDWLLYPLAGWFLYRFLWPPDVPVLALGVGAALVGGLVAALATSPPQSTRWAASMGGTLWIGWTVGFYLALLRWHLQDQNHFGQRLVLLVLAAAFAGDTAAYLVGSAFGRHRFFASISPKKSLEGAVAGLAATVFWTVVASALLIGLPIWQGVILGALLAVAEQGGDLVESALKRAAGVKDSSKLIPGHGGLLDRMDSLLLIAPVAYAFFKVVMLA